MSIKNLLDSLLASIGGDRSQSPAAPDRLIHTACVEWLSPLCASAANFYVEYDVGELDAIRMAEPYERLLFVISGFARDLSRSGSSRLAIEVQDILRKPFWKIEALDKIRLAVIKRIGSEMSKGFLCGPGDMVADKAEFQYFLTTVVNLTAVVADGEDLPELSDLLAAVRLGLED
jgi:hypothetical protein